MKIVKLLLFLSLLVFIGSCKPKYKEEEIPSYVRVSKVKVGYNGSEDSSFKISDVWLTVGNSSLGAYELPARIPVLASGKQHLVFYSGIKENGIASTRVTYPFYKTWETDADLVRTKISEFNPVFYYKPGIQKYLDLDFIHSWQKDLKIDTASCKYAIDTVGQGQLYASDNSLHITLTPEKKSFFATANVSKKTFVYTPGQQVWMEISFKGDVPIHTGFYSIDVLTGTSGTVFYVDLNATEKWNKVYINLGSRLAEEKYGNQFQFLFYATNDDASATKNIWIDNVKILYFQ